MALGLYVHVPFCRWRCDFCAFYLRIHREDWALSYLEALRLEIGLHASRQTLTGRRPDTLYFGGGTPTTLKPEQLTGLVTEIRNRLDLAPLAEMTVEAHPATVTGGELRKLLQAGFNRISFGAQSMAEDELLAIGRRTTATAAGRAVAAARETGFTNINLDLIFGLPGQTMDSWRATVEAALALDPAHLSCYALTVEEKTHLHVVQHRGDDIAPDPDLQNAMEEAAADWLTQAGFIRYEISNYCRPGLACRHNLLYWQGGDYLGFGPSAQSYLDGSRFGNVEDLSRYQQMLAAGHLPIDNEEKLDAGRRLREALVFGLRLLDGVTVPPAAAEVDGRLAVLASRGLLERTGGRAKLTALGRRFADQVAVELL